MRADPAGLGAIDDRGRRRRRPFSLLIMGGTGVASAVLAGALSADGTSVLDVAVLVPFAITFAWISGAFWTAVAGALVELRPALGIGPRPATGALDPAARTALLVPVFHEDVDQVARHVEAVEQSLARTGRANAFDWFILSDSRNPDVVADERALWARLWVRLGGGRIFYRHREDNHGRKAGNVADWCRRWGGSYRYFVVLDADSLMAGDTLVELVGLMEANPDAGLMQTVPQPVGGHTPLARLVQFAAALPGRVLARGLAYLCPGAGNYWGHNAIVRTAAFMASAGLPSLPGPPPLGGEIMSHDFVEAALLRRAGWAVWLLPDLGGSWEGLPPTLREHVRRDRRWCQGNLQHLRVLMARGLSSVSRVHLASGAMAYLASPLWLLLIALAALAGLSGHGGAPVPEFGTGIAKGWPLLALVAWTAFMLLGPRILAAALTIADPERRRQFGGAGRILGGLALEFGASLLLAPLQAFHHSLAVAGALLGRSVGWGAQDRQGSGESWRGAIALHGGATLLGVLMAAALLFTAPGLLPWLAPVLVGLLLAVPVAVFVSRAPKVRTRPRTWLLIPDELAPPPELGAMGLVAGTPVLARVTAPAAAPTAHDDPLVLAAATTRRAIMAPPGPVPWSIVAPASVD